MLRYKNLNTVIFTTILLFIFFSNGNSQKKINEKFIKSNLKSDNYMLNLYRTEIPVIEIQTEKGYKNKINKISSNNLKLNQEEILFKTDYKSIDNFGSVTNINCSRNNCKFPNKCSLDNNECICFYLFAEFDNNKKDDRKKNGNLNNKIYCNYKRKIQNVYFILEFLVNFGLGHIYAHNYLIGICKGLFVSICLLLMSLNYISIKCFKNDLYGNKSKYIIGILIVIITSIWILDSLSISLGFYTDGNGIPLVNWN